MESYMVFLVILIAMLSIGIGLITVSWPLDWISESDFDCTLQLEYDYIIVGGGTAGGVLANRLSENRSVSVLILEAGPVRNWMSQVPLLATALQRSSFYDWKFVTEPQNHSSWGLHDKRSFWPAGKGLGGSSIINYMVHMRGTPNDYNKWQEVHGCAEWSYHNLLPFFTASESVCDTSSFPSGDSRGCHGPLHVEQSSSCNRSVICSAFMQSMEKSAYAVGNLNQDLEYGTMPIESNIFRGKRFSVFEGYINPAVGRPNLHISINSKVHKILFDKHLRASGVQFTHHNVEMSIKARKEIILSAGTVNTPLLLLASGISRRQELQKLKIHVIGDLPVGHNLQDHLSLPVYFHVDGAVGIMDVDTIFQMQTIVNFLFDRKGPLTRTGVSAVARIQVPCTTMSCNRSGLVLVLLEIGSLDSSLYAAVSNMKIMTFHSLFPESDGPSKAGFIILILLTNPYSKGTVTFENNLPVIRPNYLEDIRDVHALAYGIRFVASLMEKQPMTDAGVRMHLPELRECATFYADLNDDEFLECWIRTGAITAYHPIGTSKMGHADDDDDAVVDCSLRVKNVHGLRVVDASVIPSHISSMPMATIVAMAEKAAQLIANDSV